MNIAKGSLSELDTQLLISVDLGYLDARHRIFDLLERVARLVTGFHRKAVGSTT